MKAYKVSSGFGRPTFAVLECLEFDKKRGVVKFAQETPVAGLGVIGDRYFDDFDEAKRYMIDSVDRFIKANQSSLKDMESLRAAIENLIEP